MPRQFVLECLVDLPDDAFDQNDIITQMKAPWQALTAALAANGVKFQSKSEIMESRLKPGPKIGTPRAPRKPKAATYPGTLLATAPEAAE